MERMPEINRRIKELIDYHSNGNELAFATLIGVSQPRINRLFKTDPRSNKYPQPSLDIIQSIINKFINTDIGWLITGKGSMIVDENNITDHTTNMKLPEKTLEYQSIPLYNIEATAGLKELFSSEHSSKTLESISIPNMPRCDGAIPITGDSMYPLLKSGDIVLYAQSTVDNIFWGEMYLISIRIDDFDEFITVKYVQKSAIEDHVKLVSQNQHHSPKDVHIKDIVAIALIKASIRFNTMM